MDDTTIATMQNRCLKEVIKELSQYEEESEAKVSYSKTQGIWIGSWKGRRVSRMEKVKWASRDVENLGIYFDYDNPSQKTFQEILPKFKRHLA